MCGAVHNGKDMLCFFYSALDGTIGHCAVMQRPEKDAHFQKKQNRQIYKNSALHYKMQMILNNKGHHQGAQKTIVKKTKHNSQC